MASPRQAARRCRVTTASTGRNRPHRARRCHRTIDRARRDRAAEQRCGPTGARWRGVERGRIPRGWARSSSTHAHRRAAESRAHDVGKAAHAKRANDVIARPLTASSTAGAADKLTAKTTPFQPAHRYTAPQPHGVTRITPPGTTATCRSIRPLHGGALPPATPWRLKPAEGAPDGAGPPADLAAGPAFPPAR